MNQYQDELRPYRTFGLTMLQLMGLIGALGIIATIVLHYI